MHLLMHGGHALELFNVRVHLPPNPKLRPPPPPPGNPDILSQFCPDKDSGRHSWAPWPCGKCEVYIYIYVYMICIYMYIYIYMCVCVCVRVWQAELGLEITNTYEANEIISCCGLTAGKASPLEPPQVSIPKLSTYWMTKSFGDIRSPRSCLLELCCRVSAFPHLGSPFSRSCPLLSPRLPGAADRGGPCGRCGPAQ